ncbi:MAG TPA: SHOCT domain-containing protein [Methylocella sp.]|nr:SHOCT domain-containing protein [Methylocella sp.]
MMRWMWGWDGGWRMPFFGLGPLLFILIIAGIVFYFVRQIRTTESRTYRPSARETLDHRYASGEITKEQYDQMKRDLAV